MTKFQFLIDDPTRKNWNSITLQRKWSTKKGFSPGKKHRLIFRAHFVVANPVLPRVTAIPTFLTPE
ncbi:hypothetical protein [uncultured Bartonella sp.]|uniref:hypothetical protein n=1 Tax=uncultured Bartonella sp. TaxID=104108 RepID=UPI00262BBDB8|nr:hypothetical protein [uncultured Bartonella sp.]